ncbi:MAG: 3'-5' exonuclease [Shewanella sp.]
MTIKVASSWDEYYQARAMQTQHLPIGDFFAAGCVPSSSHLADVDFVAMDFETTGLSPSNDDIVSIGLVPFTLRGIALAKAQHWLLKPQVPLDHESVIVHGITHNEIGNAPDLQDVYAEVLQAIQSKIVVVHYRSIEREFLDQALQLRLGEGVRFPVIDTMELEALINPLPAPCWWRFWQTNNRVSLRLMDSRERYHLPRYQQHHALTDALATAELFQAQVAWHYQPDNAISTLWC